MKRNLTEIAKELNRESCHESDAMPRLIFITDNKAQPFPEDIVAKLPEGSMVILRDYDDENRYDLGKALSYICKARGIKFLVAGDLTLCLMLGADGIHLPEYMIGEAINIKKEHPDYIITASVHDVGGVQRAEEIGLYAVLLAPIFPTHSHPETFDKPSSTIGKERLSEICNAYDIPVYALGGINEKTAREIIDTNIAGFAAIRGF